MWTDFEGDDCFSPELFLIHRPSEVYSIIFT